MKTKMLMLTLGAAAIGLGCKPKATVAAGEKPVFNETVMDLSVSPGENFYQYAGGGWMKNNPLPEDKSRYGSFDKLAEQNKEKVKAVIEKAAATKSENGSVNQQIGDFYASGMDTVAIEKAGLAPIQNYLNEIDAIDTKEKLIEVIGQLQRLQISPLFYYFAEGDMKNSNMVIANIYQGGLGMPDRDYYFDKGERAEEIRKAYLAYLQSIWQNTGSDAQTALAEGEKVMKFETRLAAASNTKLENRDPKLTYNKVDLPGLEANSPGLKWKGLFAAMKVDAPQEINLYQPKFVTEVGKMVDEESLDTWKSYLKIHLIREVSPYLPKAFVESRFAFYGKTLSGQPQMEPRWKRVQNTTSSALGEAIGQLFVQEYFPPQAKARMEQLVENLRTAFGERIRQLDWMSDSTKQQALAKLAAIRVKIGYPNKWRDYSKLAISRDSYLTNVLRSNEFDFEFNNAKIGKPVDKEEWGMTPQTVNAYYHPTNNEIVFPAAILQPPFFYLDGDDAVNYGAIGVVIGHEITHGFDDQGRQFDKNGNLKDWWTNSDTEKFNAKSQVLVNQYDQFVIKDTLHANGKLTLGENIADLGGLSISYQAFQNTLKGKEKPDPIDGFSAEQRFYLGYSLIWAQNIREAEKLRRVKEDVHSLGEHRVVGPLVNIEAFYQAFGIKEGDKMFIPQEKRAVIW
jgi:putative endopeptidase